MENVENLAIRFIGYNLLGTVFADVERGLAEVTGVGESSSSRLAGAFNSAGSVLTTVGVGILASLALIGAALFSVTSNAANFEAQMVLLHTQANMTDAEMQTLAMTFLNSSPQYKGLADDARKSADGLGNLSEALLLVAPKYGFMAEEASKAHYMIQSVVVGTAAENDGMNILTSAMMGAAVGHSNLADTASALASVMAAFPQYIGNSSAAMGILNATVGTGKMTMTDLLAALKTGIIPSLQIAGVSMQDFGGALATMTDLGNPAVQSASALRMALYLIDAPTRKSTDTLEAFGLAQADATKISYNFDGQLKTLGLTHSQLADDLRKPGGIIIAMDDLRTHMENAGMDADQQAQVIFNAFGGGKMGKAMVTLYENMDRLKLKTAEVGAGAHKLGDDFQYMVQHDPSFAIKTLWATLNSLIMALGTALFPILGMVIAKVIPFMEKMEIWIMLHKHLIQQIVTTVFIVGGAIGAVLVLGGAFMFAAGAIVTFLAPILGAIGAVAGFILGIAGSIGWFFGLVTAIGEVVSAVSGFVSTIMFGVGLVVAFFETDALAAFVMIVGASLPFLAVLAGLGIAAYIIVTHFKEIAKWFEDIAGRFIPAVTNAFKEFQQGWSPLQILAGFLMDMGVKWQTVMAIFDAGRTIWMVISAVVTDVVKSFQSLLQSVLSNTKVMGDLNTTWQALQVVLPIIGQVLVAVGIVIGALLAGAFHGLIAGLSVLIPAAITVFSGAIQVVSGIILVIKAIFVDLNTVLTDIFSGNFPKLAKDFQTLWTDLSAGIYLILKGLGNIIGGLFVGLFGTIIAFVGGFVQGFVGFFQWIYDKLVGHSIIPDLVYAVINWFYYLLNTIVTIGSTIYNGITYWIYAMYSEEIYLVSAMVNYVVYLASLLYNGFMYWINALVNGVTNLAWWLVNNFEYVIGTLLTWGSNIGAQIVNGIIAGVQNAWWGLLSTFSDLLSYLPWWVKNILGIASPSLVFAMEIGQPIAQGMAMGITQGSPLVTQAVQDTVNQATDVRISPMNASLNNSSNVHDASVPVLSDIRDILHRIEGVENTIDSFMASRRTA